MEKIKAIIYGASGMIGKGVLIECLEHPEVEKVLAIGRSTCGMTDNKLEEILMDDMMDYSAIESQLEGYNACFFCLGISSAGMSEEKYHRITYDLAVKAGTVLSSLNPQMTFCFISGAGTDSTEKGKTMWARVKGKTENALKELPFRHVYLFRPAYIQPRKGVTSRTRLYRIMYILFGFLYPVWRLLFPKYVSTSVEVGQAMINSVLLGSKQILESYDIVKLAKGEHNKITDRL